jgi:hypothetical protein
MRSFSLALILPAYALAQPLPPVKDGKVVVPMALTPTAVQKPLSRFYLTPQYVEMQPGNKIPGFMKAFMEQDSFFNKENTERRAKWDELKLEDLPVDEIKKSGVVGGLMYRDPRKAAWENTGGRPLADVDEGARLLSTDWQIWFNLRRDGIGTLLPEVQRMRSLANILKYRMRYEIRTGDFEKAAYTARTFYGMAQAFEQHPTLIGLLVGIAIESICLNAVEEMIAQPGCPNLYWALSEIPEGVLSPRMATQGERVFSQSMFGNLLKARGAMNNDDLARELKNLEAITGMMGGGDGPKMPMNWGYAIWAADPKAVEAGRKYLADTGSDAEAVRKFTPVQVMFTYDVRKYEVFFDDMMALIPLPYPDARPRAETLEAALANDKESILARQMLPAIWKIREALTRTQQRVASLRTIEAIRLYAHENKGGLPAKLSDIPLPLPNDPVTGKPFEYSLKDGTATLHGGNPNPKQPQNNRYYEITIRK